MTEHKFSLKDRTIQALLSRITTSRLSVPLAIACVLGIVTGFVIVGFVKVVGFSEDLFMNQGTHALSFLGRYAIILIPALGGLIVGLIVTFVSPEAKGHGVPEVMKAVTLRGGKIRPVVILGKFFASVIALGSGASVGREGPIVQIGAALGSNLGRFFRLTESRVKNLVACGAAAGIAGVFNAPIAGVMFSLEVILRDFGARAMSTVVVAAVSSSIIARVFLGETPAFIAPSYSLHSSYEIFLYLILGIISAFASVLFMRSLHRSEHIFENWKFPAWLKPAVGGLLVGCIGFFTPQVFGSGLRAIEQAIHGDLGWKLLVALIFLKIAATSFSLGSGTSGGVFAPALFVGAVLGGSLGYLFQSIIPFDIAPPGAYALVGMASVFAGAAHAPVTAILIVFEMTGDYHMILPIMIATVVATSLSQALQRESIYTMKLRDHGIDVDSLEEVSVLGAIQVRDAMTEDFVIVPREMPVKALFEKMAHEKHKSIYVSNSKGEAVGVIWPERMQEVLFEKELPIFVADDLSEPLPETCYPDDSLTEVAHLMMKQKLGQIPVVNHSTAHYHEIIGVLKSESIFRAYTEMSVKRADLIKRFDHQETTGAGVQQIHFLIPSRCKLVGKAIKEMEIPDGVVLTTVQRRSKSIVPEGNTTLLAKDQLWAVVLPENEKEFRLWLKSNHLQVFSFFD